MGLASWVLSRIWKPVGLGMQVGKLIRECRDTRLLTGPRILRIAEEVVIFLARQKNSKAALALYAGKIIGRRIQSSREAGNAIAILSALSNPSGLADGDIETALCRLDWSLSSTKAQDAIAGIAYVSLMHTFQDHDSIASKYRTKEGFFNGVACLRDFYSSPVPRLMALIDHEPSSDLDLLIQDFWDSSGKPCGSWRNDLLPRKMAILSLWCMRDCSSHRTVHIVLNDALSFLIF